MRRLWRFRRLLVVLAAFYAAPFVFVYTGAAIVGGNATDVFRTDMFWAIATAYFLFLFPIIVTAILSNGKE